ncbi:glycosyl transferase family 90-domain-containing protein [Aspergillus karnatakaensis]|uniref:glycosyl transferase family 90-domain-containing protein n=1 Tax=Aspergillus karnatakaensis TaxID=1810916 RepID=UPI003CCE4570
MLYLRPRLIQSPTIIGILLTLTITTFTAGLLLWYTMNSDRSYIHPLLTQLIPAGHATCESATIFECSSCLSCPTKISLSPSHPTWEFDYARDGHNAGLSREQCTAAFPGLFEDISRATAYWRDRENDIETLDLDTIPLNPGMARARIANGELYVLATNSRTEDHRRKILAALSSMHRALVTAPPQSNSQPESGSEIDITFLFSISDKLPDITTHPSHTTSPLWTLSRKTSEQAVWLMPDFGFWSWDHAHTEIGPFDAVVADAMEYDRIPWGKKIPKLVWRGKPSFAPKLRRALLDSTQGKGWADVRGVDWHGDGSDNGEGNVNVNGNVLGLGEHCRYMFIAHVEGRSYSASLKYRQSCNSVLITHELQYIQHHHYLLISSGPEQNHVQVSRDFSDLEPMVLALLADPAEAQRIAENSVRTFRERYLTRAAEACYWRSLWEAYSKAFNESWSVTGSGGDRKVKGMRYESFVLQPSGRMMGFDAGDPLVRMGMD